MQQRNFNGAAVFDGKVLHPAAPGSPSEEWIVPAFINAHCHLELSYLKGALPRHTGLPRFLEGVMQLRREAPGGDKAGAAARAAAALHGAGTAAVGDICNTTDALEVKKEGPLSVHSFIEVLGVRDGEAEQRMTGALAVLEAHRAAGLAAGLTAHAPYSCGPELLRRLNKATPGGIISVHNGETGGEQQLFETGTGPMMDFYRHTGLHPNSIPLEGSALRYWLGHFREGQTVLLVHNTFTTEAEVDWAADHAAAYGLRLFWVLCPGANGFIEDRMPPAPMLWRKGCTVALGTDSLASNDVLDPAAEMKLLHAAFPEIPVTVLMQWATFNGAEALGFSNLGRIESGTDAPLLSFHPRTFKASSLA